jgi:DNA integrity scanning protein DisA with diadenylate cyclase activity
MPATTPPTPEERAESLLNTAREIEKRAKELNAEARDLRAEAKELMAKVDKNETSATATD